MLDSPKSLAGAGARFGKQHRWAWSGIGTVKTGRHGGRIICLWGAGFGGAVKHIGKSLPGGIWQNWLVARFGLWGVIGVIGQSVPDRTKMAVWRTAVGERQFQMCAST